MLLSRVLTGAMLMGGISTKPHTPLECVGLGALLGPGATGHHNKKTPRVGVGWLLVRCWVSVMTHVVVPVYRLLRAAGRLLFGGLCVVCGCCVRTG